MRRAPHDRLRRFVRDVFIGHGVPPDDAEISSDVLITADLQGIDSHGINRLKYYCDRFRAGVTRAAAGFQIVKETPTTAVVDGHDGLGHVIGVRAMRLAIAKAGQTGLGAVAVRNSTHYGIAGYYPLMAIREGMLGLTSSNARPCITPTFGIEPMFGTNPLAFGAPTDEPCPFLFDAALSVTQRGKIELLRREGKTAPEGWGIDDAGQPLADPDRLLADFLTGRAALFPLGGAGELFGGHKGYGLSIMVEILCSALQSGRFLTDLGGGDREGKWEPYHLGHFFLALRIESFIPLDDFKKATGEILRRLRRARKAPGAERIWTAGEKEWETMTRRLRDGIPIGDDLQRELRQLRDDLGMPVTALPF